MRKTEDVAVKAPPNKALPLSASNAASVQLCAARRDLQSDDPGRRALIVMIGARAWRPLATTIERYLGGAR